LRKGLRTKVKDLITKDENILLNFLFGINSTILQRRQNQFPKPIDSGNLGGTGRKWFLEDDRKSYLQNGGNISIL
jgi:hypothetical protein